MKFKTKRLARSEYEGKICLFYTRLCGRFPSNPFRTARATKVAQSFFVITRHASATEVFKPSTDAESLLGSIKKKFFFIQVRGSPGEGSQSGGVFVFFTNFDEP